MNNIDVYQKELFNNLISNDCFENTKNSIFLTIKNGGNLHKPITEEADYIFHILVSLVCNAEFKFKKIDNNRRQLITNKKYYKDKDILKKCYLMLSLDCDVNALNNNDETPIDKLCKIHTNNIIGKNQMILFLLESGGYFNFNNIKKELENSIYNGYNKYNTDIYYGNIIKFLSSYNSISDYILYSSTLSLKYIFRNKRDDFLMKMKTIFTNMKTFEDYIKSLQFLLNIGNNNNTTKFFMNEREYKIQYSQSNISNKKCKLIINLLKNSFNWSPSIHLTKNNIFKKKVKLLLNIENKLDILNKDEFFLPKELWFLIFTFM